MMTTIYLVLSDNEKDSVLAICTSSAAAENEVARLYEQRDEDDCTDYFISDAAECGVETLGEAIKLQLSLIASRANRPNVFAGIDDARAVVELSRVLDSLCELHAFAQHRIEHPEVYA